MPVIHWPEPAIDYGVPGTRRSDKPASSVLRFASEARCLLWKNEKRLYAAKVALIVVE